MDISLNHPILQSQSAMRSFCKPLLQHTAWSFFDYERFYDDGSWFNINTTDPEVIYRYSQEDMFLNQDELQRRVNSIDLLSNCDLVKSQLNDTPTLLSDIRLHVEHKLDNRVYLYRRKQHYYEVCGFGLGLDNSINPIELAKGFYQNYATLIQFVSYFLFEAHELLQEVEHHRLMLPVPTLTNPNNPPKWDFNCNKLADFLAKQPVKINGLQLTAAESNCLLPYLQGATAKEIAVSNSNSYRTVEKHIDNIKKKVGVTSRDALASLVPAYFFNSSVKNHHALIV